MLHTHTFQAFGTKGFVMVVLLGGDIGVGRIVTYNAGEPVRPSISTGRTPPFTSDFDRLPQA